MANKFHTPSGREVWTRERCFVEELLNDPGTPDVSVARCRIEPGVTTERHSLSVLEWYVIWSGHGRLQLDDDPPRDVGPGDAIRIDAGRAQCIANTGAKDLVFLCVCVPRYTPTCYTPLERDDPD